MSQQRFAQPFACALSRPCPSRSSVSRACGGCDAAVFIPSGKADAAAVAAATKHFTAYGSVPVFVASAKPVSGLPGIAVPAMGARLAEALEREIIEAVRAKRIKGRATTPLTKAYVTRAKLLADAADVALDLAPPKMKLLYESLKAAALHPQLGFDKMGNLGSVESGLFAYWNETKGPHVTKFWAQVAARKLPFSPR